MNLAGKHVGFAMTGSFCTFEAALAQMKELVMRGAAVTPILSYSADTIDTRFMTAASLKEKIAGITARPVIRTMVEAEPIGPEHLLDIVLILPATGNTLAKLALGITDTPVLMAAKAHLRNDGPVVLGLATNDALGNAGKNLGALLNTRNIYFVPIYQDDPAMKPRSMVFKGECVLRTLEEALDGRQLSPLITVK